MFVYVLAWGIIDPFFSIFIHGIVRNYTLAGLFYSIFFLIGVFFSAPIGGLAGKVNKIRFTVVSMLAYPFIGLFYFSLAFIPASLVWLVLLFARVLHGFAALFWVMVEDIIRERSPKGKTSATFGIYLTFNKFAFVVAPAFIILGVVFFGLNAGNLHFLLLALIPFPLVSAFLVSRIRSSGERFEQAVKEVVVEDAIIRKELQDLKQLGFVGFFTLLIGFFIRVIEVVIFFLLPLYILSSNLGIVDVSLVFALINFPYLFSFFLANFADRFGKTTMISVGFFLAAFCFLGLAFFSEFPVLLFGIALLLGFILALLQPAVNGLITDITPRVQDGEMTGVLRSVLETSAFAATVLIGFLADAFSLSFPFIVFAFVLVLMAVLTYSIKSKIVVRI
jgi:MFS family permease